ncbi:hypothetical protein DBR42_00500 [Pelomonas sp. HMWF004]|nr:hypothetical protein DBR42_00500 [Pelomonas sp. HMWF004]
MLNFAADRDSVCAGDDCESHLRPFTAPQTARVTELIRLATNACRLASIAGGQATWIVEAGGIGGQPIAVMAQQWAEPRLLVADTATVERVFTNLAPQLFFRYWCQADPDAVFSALAAGTALPDRHSST